MPDFELEKHCLSCFKVEVFCNFVFVNLDTNAISLAEQAGDLAEDLKLRAPFLDQLKPILTDTGRPTNIDANWKVVMDNFLECYHCPKGHPEAVHL
jgi:choline monooxygenase